MGDSVTKNRIKCVVWDLDNTLWDGVLLESTDVPGLRPHVRDVIEAFDQRGILQSLASKNEPGPAMAALAKHGLDQYFLYPQISWNSKSQAIGTIAERLNIGIDTFAFIDDQAFERDEVLSVHPSVRTFSEAGLEQLPALQDFVPLHVTADSKNRRQMYQKEALRAKAQEDFKGPEDAFLRTLGLKLRLKPASEEDLYRAEELTLRTNQLNTTGVTYSAGQLRDLIASAQHQVIVAELEDRYGSYGAIGLLLISQQPGLWCIDLFLMSCRVMSRGVGGVILTALRKTCHNRQLGLAAQFRETDRNRMMFITYRFAGFREEGDLLMNELTSIPALPDYMQLDIDAAMDWRLQ
ncbi:HAD-IIIC family phosphatase [Pseudohongiella sp.]|uniref:N-acetyltransferase domain-containing protein n=1 Tax=marine sediment metagenome TaxID=412755 RepID=A0A0F9WJU2_9ZZZZ|nr:HAD-IIIC family phosphatase [Pseudohongiella sp.]HDZ08113.1 HAD-IIIC family phosphatase [Pseudohongiella sp.]HEA63081.1 HAD-IIIC family phosphatase [Pseudohongiella sp.]